MRIAPESGLFFCPAALASARLGLFAFMALLLFLLPACGAPLPAASPCWIQVFAEPGFSPAADHDIFFGPAEWTELRHLPQARRADWGGGVQSLLSGPAATVVLWPQPDFSGPAMKIQPGEAVDCVRRLGIGNIHSLVIACAE